VPSEPVADSVVSAERSGAQARDAPLVLEGIRKSFGSNEVLKGVGLSLQRGELLAVLGGNGCGKSTLLRCAIRLLDPDAGSSRLCGSDLAALNGRALRVARREAAVIFQQIALVKQRTALDNVCAGALGQIPLWRSLSTASFPSEVRERATIALQRVRMLEQAWQKAGTLSGGQAQRVAIARAYCQQASVILADEPVSALDPRAAEEVLELLRDLAESDGLAVLAVLHQPDLALRHAHRVIGMKAGEVAFDRRASEIAPEEIDALYVHLHEA
jgi:phosphonate transport system ATP-binding protein